jgi:predicted nucleic acid-binding protein
LEKASGIHALPVDEAAARVWARMRAHLAETGCRVRINDLWIAAANQLPVVTQDDDFDPLEGFAGLAVVRV